MCARICTSVLAEGKLLAFSLGGSVLVCVCVCVWVSEADPDIHDFAFTIYLLFFLRVLFLVCLHELRWRVFLFYFYLFIYFIIYPSSSHVCVSIFLSLCFYLVLSLPFRFYFL